MEDNEKIEQSSSPVGDPVQDVIEPQPESPTPQETVSAKNTALESNIRALHEKSERIEAERNQYYQRMRELELKNQPQPQEEEDLSLNIGDDDISEGKHLKKVQKYNQREFAKQKKELEELKKSTTTMMVETRLKLEHPDLDSVVTESNLKMLAETYPEIAATLHASPDYYSKAKSAYTLIKKFGIVPDNDFTREKELAQKNSNKPRPLASISAQKGDSPLTQVNAFANGITREDKARLRKEVEDAIKYL